MHIDYTKLLPAQIRDTRWADILTVVGSILEDIKTDKIDIIKTQNEILSMTDDQLVSFAANFGYTIINLTGYTDTIDYLRKEVYTIIPRILSRTTPEGYNAIFTIFNLLGQVYPTYYDGTTYLHVLENWVLSDENPTPYDTLDAGGAFILFYILFRYDLDFTHIDDGITYDETITAYDNPAYSTLTDTTLDEIVFPSLDATSILDQITRHLVLKYAFKYAENTTEFLSDETLKALYTDTMNQKRRTEIAYFEPVVTVATNDDNTLTTETIYNYDHSTSTTIKSILIGADLSTAFKIRFGDSAHTTIDGTITDVNHFSRELLVSDCDTTLTSAIAFDARRKIIQKCTFTAFTEIAIWDSANVCIYYATFPKIRYYTKMYGNVAFDITLV
jgi:hypothetical protein